MATATAKRRTTRTTTTARNQSGRTNGRGAKPAPASRLTHEQIAQRAYEIWLAKGQPIGLDEEIWRQAETELSPAA